MPNYSLTILFDEEGLSTLNSATQQVAIVKQTTPSTSPVIWVAFTPELENTITWTDSYSVYGSSTGVDAGTVITTESTLQATGGETYPFEGGQFQDGVPNLSNSTEFGIQNLDQGFRLLTAGLAQSASGLPQPASGSAPPPLTPLNATMVPYNETANYTPIEKVFVFAYAEANNGLVISSVSSNALEVDMTDPSQVTQTIHYDGSINQFVLGPFPTARRRSRAS